MNILVCGANGFIGRHIVLALVNAGHQVTCAASRPADNGLPFMPVDFAADRSVKLWRGRVAGFDAVVNAVGVLRDSARRPMHAVHEDTPAALFEACALEQVQRVVHLSATNIDHNPTEYARSKRAAEAALVALLPRAGIALRPCLVMGAGSDATELFKHLARLPWLPLPASVANARVQPLHVCELAAAVVHLVGHPAPTGVVAFGGAQELSLRELLDTLRRMQQGPRYRAARVIQVPEWMAAASARIGDWLPLLPWCTETRAMLAQDNLAPSAPLRHWLGHALLAVHEYFIGADSDPRRENRRVHA